LTATPATARITERLCRSKTASVKALIASN
jgi:hypothetical protein